MLETFTPSFFRRLQQLKIHTRRSFLGSRQGGHLSLRKGHGLEFSDYRLYTPGDDFRHIDWGVYGRTDRIYVRQFREEQDLHVLMLLDASASMGYPKGERKFELAKELSLALGYVALTDGDAVNFCFLGQGLTPTYVGPGSLHRAAKALEDLEAKNSFDFPTEVRAAISRQKVTGKCFFISDFLIPNEETFRAIDLLRAKNFDISVIQILAPSELSLDLGPGDALVIDAETGEEVELIIGAGSRETYAKMLSEQVAELEDYCAKAGIRHLLVSSKEELTDLVLTRLPELGLLN